MDHDTFETERRTEHEALRQEQGWDTEGIAAHNALHIDEQIEQALQAARFPISHLLQLQPHPFIIDEQKYADLKN